jgi:Fe2+ transport system protein FeoA
MQEEVNETEMIGLHEVTVGDYARVRSLPENQALSTRLRELGICENSVLRLLNHSYGSIVFEVNQSRFGMSKNTARSVLVSFER